MPHSMQTPDSESACDRESDLVKNRMAVLIAINGVMVRHLIHFPEMPYPSRWHMLI